MKQTVSNFVKDSYQETIAKGKVIGSKHPDGFVRQGIDAEKIITIDNGALRFPPLVNPGWGRQGIAYGAYTRTNGLACTFFLLNGHNTSQSGDYAESIFRRLKQWIVGSHKQSPIKKFSGWLRSYKRESLIQRIYRWIRSSKKYVALPTINENLAVGWFPQAITTNPLTQGNGFIVHATGTENGELWVTVGRDEPMRVLRGLQNLPIYYVVILREQGAAYYAASLPNAHGLAAYPNLRPLGIDHFNQEKTVYGAVYQSVLGQIGFTVDTRVYGATVKQIPELSNWYGTACAADSLQGNGLLATSAAEIGGVWQVVRGSYERTIEGVKATGIDNLAILHPKNPLGLIHVVIKTSDIVACGGIVWRFHNNLNYCCALLTDREFKVSLFQEGKETEIATANIGLKPNSLNSLQILDDGETIGIYLNGKLVLDRWLTDTRLQNSTGVGIYTNQAHEEQYWQAFEAHPRAVCLPAELDLGSPWQAEGKQIVVTDTFTGNAGDLAGKTTTTGEKVWRRDLGRGIIKLTGQNSAKVQASRQKPNPGRTAYTINWDEPSFADIKVDIIPPGTKRKQKEKGRGGLIFWQDRDNYIIINNWLDDCYGGASISSFFYLNGFEDVYDAVWTNVGSRVYWGIKHTLRVVFDGVNYIIFVNGEPVLYRALTDVYPQMKSLLINRVGIVANWEWGDDTGSIFTDFIAKK